MHLVYQLIHQSIEYSNQSIFLEDIKNSHISLVNVRPLVLNDSCENPLFGKEFRDDNGELITLNQIFKNYFCLSWTEENKDEEYLNS
jgi:hypothetical protein